MDDRAGTAEHRDFHKGVVDHVGQAAQEARRSHQRQGKEDVGEVADGGKRQPPLEMRRPQRPGGTIDDGHDGRGHHHVLGPGPPQKVRAEAEVNQPHDGEGACLHHCHCMQQGGNRRRRHRGIRQPLVEGEDRRLDAKAEKCSHKYDQQRVLMAGDQVGIQHASIGEVQVSHAVIEQKDHPDERE